MKVILPKGSKKSRFFSLFLIMMLITGFAMPLSALAEEIQPGEEQVQTETPLYPEAQVLEEEPLVELSQWEKIPLAEDLKGKKILDAKPQPEDAQVQIFQAQNFEALAGEVCKIGDVGYASFEDALTAVNADETITLLTDITCTAGLEIMYKSLTIDVGAHTLTAGSATCLTGLSVTGGSEIHLERTTGSFNVEGRQTALNVSDGTVTISNAIITSAIGADGICYGVRNSNGTVTVLGDVEINTANNSLSYFGVSTAGEGACSTLVRGDVRVNGGSNSIGVCGSWNSDTTVEGGVFVSGAGYSTTGVFGEYGSSIWVEGDVTCDGWTAIDAREDSVVRIMGNVTCENGKGVDMTGQSETTIDGVVTAKEGHYVTISDACYFDFDDFVEPTTKEGYRTYRDASGQYNPDCTTWVKIPGQDPGPEPDTFTVTFDSQGGSAVNKLTGIQSGAAIAEPAEPTRRGHTFEGWYKESSCQNAWDFDTDKVNGNITLYAKWEASSTGGTGSGSRPSVSTTPAIVTSYATPSYEPTPAPDPLLNVGSEGVPAEGASAPEVLPDLPKTGYEPFPWYLVFAGLGIAVAGLLTFRKVCEKK